ncbi:hypothetical protein G9A89_000978 [Geosiphon pyriformis]|nr:hypothetical protein G9A89_000978 [Geosiphon pyriformis]
MSSTFIADSLPGTEHILTNFTTTYSGSTPEEQPSNSTSFRLRSPSPATTHSPSEEFYTTRQYSRLYRDIPLLDRHHTPKNIAIYSFLIGVIFGAGISFALYSQIPQLGVFFATLAVFHILEYLLTAIVNSEKLSMDAFLIHNGLSYHVAHLAGLIEFVIELYLFPELKKVGWIAFLGLVLIILGQTTRSLAMWHAKSNFSHQIVYQKHQDHELVTTGIYSISRHPSYFGFYYWALGTQLLLFNPICFFGYLVALHRFFRDRIRNEEPLLIKFFGDDYVRYRQRVGVWIPFIK